MQTFQNSLYINLDDPTNAVIYDKQFVLDAFAKCDLGIVSIIPPEMRGFQWTVIAAKNRASEVSDFPEDRAPVGLARPPLSMDKDPS